ncbi:spore coat protein U domain-containing protein [Glaciimonas soli]|uniref:SCPU domain-containing protein n=1 Tax=Glaciimonas soli TaxID=2590999 RepID=A0A843YQ83_9BURK|nr:spore coat protein U domain-containing protein [Glaciimonas soli]MQQ99550.1 SCPU domain-containing protein [Glaciimonas soli]
MKKVILITTAVVLMTGSASANAATATSTMTNTVTISNNCTIAATGFTTTYDPIVANASTVQNATATVTTTCTLGDATTVTLDQGANAASGSTAAAPLRRVKNGTTYLNYGLYSDTGHTVTWGSTGVSGTGTGLPVALPIYAQLPAGQAGAAGTYTDTVIATVTY